jgi:hypothetical protein
MEKRRFMNLIAALFLVSILVFGCFNNASNNSGSDQKVSSIEPEKTEGREAAENAITERMQVFYQAHETFDQWLSKLLSYSLDETNTQFEDEIVESELTELKDLVTAYNNLKEQVEESNQHQQEILNGKDIVTLFDAIKPLDVHLNNLQAGIKQWNEDKQQGIPQEQGGTPGNNEIKIFQEEAKPTSEPDRSEFVVDSKWGTSTEERVKPTFGEWQRKLTVAVNDFKSVIPPDDSTTTPEPGAANNDVNERISTLEKELGLDTTKEPAELTVITRLQTQIDELKERSNPIVTILLFALVFFLVWQLVPKRIRTNFKFPKLRFGRGRKEISGSSYGGVENLAGDNIQSQVSDDRLKRLMWDVFNEHNFVKRINELEKSGKQNQDATLSNLNVDHSQVDEYLRINAYAYIEEYLTRNFDIYVKEYLNRNPQPRSESYQGQPEHPRAYYQPEYQSEPEVRRISPASDEVSEWLQQYIDAYNGSDRDIFFSKRLEQLEEPEENNRQRRTRSGVEMVLRVVEKGSFWLLPDSSKNNHGWVFPKAQVTKEEAQALFKFQRSAAGGKRLIKPALMVAKQSGTERFWYLEEKGLIG